MVEMGRRTDWHRERGMDVFDAAIEDLEGRKEGKPDRKFR